MDQPPAPAAVASPPPPKRHALTTRLWHWTNALVLLVMLMSGLTIFNAHPRLYWGEYGANFDPAWLQIGTTGNEGYLRVGSLTIETTGVLGRWRDSEGNIRNRAFPYWSTIPSRYSLADGRSWHFFFAWIFALGLTFFMLRSLWNRHIQRDLHVRREEWRPSHIWQDAKGHGRLNFRQRPVGAPYNVLQKLAYIAVIFILLPVMIFTGLTMSPMMNGNWPFLLDLFGGRQSARSIHFIAAALLVLFFVLHIVLVVLNRPVRHIAAMITGGRKADEE